MRLSFCLGYKSCQKGVIIQLRDFGEVQLFQNDVVLSEFRIDSSTFLLVSFTLITETDFSC